MNKAITLIVLALLLLQQWNDVADGQPIECYNCQYSYNPTLVGYECVTSPVNSSVPIPTIPCHEGCQTEVRSQDDWYTIYHINRGCKLTTAVDGEWKCSGELQEVCIETCTEDLCNAKDCDVTAFNRTSPTTTTYVPPSEVPGTISCYSCVYSYNEAADTSCIDNPGSLPAGTVRCAPDRDCFVFRQYDHALNVMRSFSRGCEARNGRPEECQVHDTYFETCNSFCETELCNYGDGYVPPPQVGGSGRVVREGVWLGAGYVVLLALYAVAR